MEERIYNLIIEYDNNRNMIHKANTVNANGAV